ncbi:hypothetical protein NKH54_23455 [Mesorhizobium sp. M1004]|uniref:hypothetical protein n=1 Tax=Mesorhizobium sp. M1004 TaxID=2957046 RepID=UPI003337EF3B
MNLNKPEGRRAFLPDSALREAAPSSRSVSLALELLEHSLLDDGPQRTLEKMTGARGDQLGCAAPAKADIWSAAVEVMTYSVDRRYAVIT